MKYVLRDYQRQAVDAGLAFFKRKNRKNGIIVAPTGSGKALLVANIAKALDAPTIVFQPTLEILNQNLEKLRAYGHDANVYSASAGEKTIGNLTYATIGSVMNALELFEDFKYIIIDEGHLVNPNEGTMYADFINFTGAKVLATTATPTRLRQYNFPVKHSKINLLTRTRPKIFHEFVHITQIQDIVEGGWWSKLKYIQVKPSNEGLEVNTTGADFKKKSLEENFVLADIGSKIINTIEELPDRKHVLVFVPSVDEAKVISEKLPSASYVHGGTKKKERKQLLADFEAGKIKVMFSVGVLSIGYDFPELDTIILARPTMSLTVYMQQSGRGTRPHSNKKDCVIVDLVGNVERFGKLENFVFKDIKGLGLYSGNKLLTGVPLETLSEASPDEETIAKYQNVKMTFGKYAGKPLRAVPLFYLSWVKKNVERTHRNEEMFAYINAKNIN